MLITYSDYGLVVSSLTKLMGVPASGSSGRVAFTNLEVSQNVCDSFTFVIFRQYVE